MIAWDRVDTVLLDMDGTLLDLHFDNHFWHEHVPRRYAERHTWTSPARAELSTRYKRVEGTLDWYCVDYWTRELDLDIERLKQEIEWLLLERNGLIAVIVFAGLNHFHFGHERKFEIAAVFCKYHHVIFFLADDGKSELELRKGTVGKANLDTTRRGKVSGA